MSIKSNKTILNLFFTALALIALSACGGGGGGGGTAGTSDNACKGDFCRPSQDAKDPDNPNADFVFVTAPAAGEEKAVDVTTDYRAYVPYTYSGTDDMQNANLDRYTTVTAPDSGGDTVAQAVAKIRLDTEYSNVATSSSDGDGQNGIDLIGTAYAHARGYTGKRGTTPNSIVIANLGRGIGVTSSTPELNGDTISFVIESETPDLTVEGSVTETRVGNLVTTVTVGKNPAKTMTRTTRETRRQSLITGYTANDPDNIVTPGACVTCATRGQVEKDDSSLVGIMSAQPGDGLQGIAFDASIKPVNIFAGDIYKAATPANRASLVLAIREASGADANVAECAAITDMAMKTASPDCATITVMNNGWDVASAITPDASFGVAVTVVNDINEEETHNFYYKLANKMSTISDVEAAAWVEAVETTVVVFGAGDYGHNSENGIATLYEDENFETVARSVVTLTNSDAGFNDHANKDRFSPVGEMKDGIAWNLLDAENKNRASSHARLPLEVASLKGKWLTVVAVNEPIAAPTAGDADRMTVNIAPFSNGCGDAMAWCLAAPGVDITTITAESNLLKQRSGTGIAAAHVSGAIAVLKGAFPNLTPTQLVSIILNTADDLGVAGVDAVYGHGSLNLARATDPIGSKMTATPMGTALGADASLDNSGITLPTSFGGALDGFTVGFIDDYKRAYIGNPARITRENAGFTLADTLATWESPTLQSIALDSNSKMQFTNYEENSDARDTLIFTHHLPNHTIGFSYNEESKTPDLNLANTGDDMHFQKIRPIANDLMQVSATHKLGKKLTVKNAITSGEFDTGNRFNEAMANLNYTGENHNLTIGAGTLQEYEQFLGASGTGAYQLSDATQSTVTHLAVTQNLPLGSAIKLKYTGFKTEVDMRYDSFAKINDLTADEYQLSFGKKQVLGKNDSLNVELIQPFAVTDGKLQQSTVLGYNAEGDYNNVVQSYDLKPTNRRQQLRMTWQNQINLERKTKLFISMQYENHVDNLRDKEDSTILGGISTKF